MISFNAIHWTRYRLAVKNSDIKVQIFACLRGGLMSSSAENCDTTKKLCAECLKPPALCTRSLPLSLWLVWITLYSFFHPTSLHVFEVEGMFTLWILWQSHTHTQSSQLGGRKCFFIYSFFISSNEPFVDINPSMYFMIMWALSFVICFFSLYLFSACHVMDIHSSNLSFSHRMAWWKFNVIVRVAENTQDFCFLQRKYLEKLQKCLPRKIEMF